MSNVIHFPLDLKFKVLFELPEEKILRMNKTKAENCKIEIDGQLYGFNDLDDSLQSDITNPKGFIWDVHYSYSDDPISDETKIQIFEQINFF